MNNQVDRLDEVIEFYTKLKARFNECIEDNSLIQESNKSLLSFMETNKHDVPYDLYKSVEDDKARIRRLRESIKLLHDDMLDESIINIKKIKYTLQSGEKIQ